MEFTESIEFLEYCFLVSLKMKITVNYILQIPHILTYSLHIFNNIFSNFENY